MRVTLRPALDSDLELIHRIYASTRTEELAPVPWTLEQKAAFLRSQSELQHRHYHTTRPDASYDLILYDGQPVGRLYVARMPGEIRIMDIALLPDYRARGLGTCLLEQLCAEADRTGCSLTAHVERNNPALRLYQRLGFQRTDEEGPYFKLCRTGSSREASGFPLPDGGGS